MYSERQVLPAAPAGLLTGDGLERMSELVREPQQWFAVLVGGWSNVIFENWSQTMGFSG